MDQLRKIIETRVFYRPVVPAKSYEEIPFGWLFDFKKILLQPEFLSAVTKEILPHIAQGVSFQVGGSEAAAIPLVTSLVMEGSLNGAPVVLIDDVLNTGKSLLRQIEVLESLGQKVVKVVVIVRFREENYYTALTERGVSIESLFTLEDFKDSLGLGYLKDKPPLSKLLLFKPEWKFSSPDPVHFYVVPKSVPALDESNVYLGSDNGTLWCLKQDSGKVAWSHKVLYGTQRKRIFSSPAVDAKRVYFGAYDGNLYALDKKTGKKDWVFWDADWIGSSPALAPDLGLIFVGLEFGLWNKRGGLVAIDTENGEKRWQYYEMGNYTHGSPGYWRKYGLVACGSNDGTMYAFRAGDGKLLWSFKTKGEIKDHVAFSDIHNLIAFGSFDSNCYALDPQGREVWKYATKDPIFSTPLFDEDRVYVGSMDKHLYCLEAKTGKLLWKFATAGRIFSSPIVVGNSVYIGSNDGRFYELDKKTGRETAFFQATERITTRPAYNSKTGVFFVPTLADELYALRRTEPK